MSPTPLRAVRIPDRLWEAAQDVALYEGTTLSDVIRDLLSEWVAEHNPDWSVWPEDGV